MARRVSSRAEPSRPRTSRAKAAGPELPTDSASPDATLAIRDAIRAHVPDAIRELARLAREASSEQARVSAINALIDRGYGDLKHAVETGDIPGLTVRFVTPPDTA